MRIAAAIAFLAGSLCLAACDNVDENFVIPFTRVGTFELQTANGLALPAILVDSVSPPLRIEAVSGNVVINADNTFSDAVLLRQTLGGVVTTQTVSCSGTFTVAGNVLTFSEVPDGNLCGETFTGTLVGRTLTATIRDVVGVFQR